MKPLINWKQKLGLMALGSVFTIIGMLLSPISAQKDKFGAIECEELIVRGGYISLRNADDEAVVHISGGGTSGYMKIYEKGTLGRRNNTHIGAGYIFFDDADAEQVNDVYIGGAGLSISDNHNEELVDIGIDKDGGYVTTVKKIYKRHKK